MATLIFLLTVLLLFALVITLIAKAIKRKPTRRVIKSIGFIVLGYAIAWLVFNSISNNVVVPMGTDVCFDDWCATITKAETGPMVQKQFSSLNTDSAYIILDVKMSNHARGIAQKPSEPRIHIIDNLGRLWPWSAKGQQQLEKTLGQQINIGQRLELGQSLQTKLVFAVPANAKGLKVLIEEGPFITKLLFPDDNLVFNIN